MDAPVGAGRILVVCEWHRGECDLTDTVQNGKRFKCKACYNAERYLQTSYKKNHRAHEWRDMSIEQRRELIVKNKDRDMGAGRGARRKFSVEEASNIQDSVKTGAKIPYMNRKEFSDHCIAKWGLTSAEIEDRWQSALRDSNVPKGIDEEGWQTIAKYSKEALTSSRKLTHDRKVTKTDAVEATEQQLKSVLYNLVENGDLQDHTGVFDVGALPPLPGLKSLAMKPKAKAKAKAKGKFPKKARRGREDHSDDDEGVEGLLALENSGAQGKLLSEVDAAVIKLEKANLKKKWVDLGYEHIGEVNQALIGAEPYDSLKELYDVAQRKASSFLAMVPDLQESEIVVDMVDRGEWEKSEWLNSHIEHASNARQSLSPRSKNLYSAAFGDQLQTAKKAKDMYESQVKSLLQASKKAKGDLIKETTKLKNKLEQEEKKRQKLAEAKEKKRLKELAIEEGDVCADGEDGESSFKSWKIFQDSAQHGLCENVLMPDLATRGGVNPGKLDGSRCIVFKESTLDDGMSLYMHDLVKKNKDSIDADPEVLKDASALRKMQANLGFPDWAKMLRPEVAEEMDDFSWALMGYLREPAHRVKSLDALMSLSLHIGNSDSTYMGLTDLTFPRFLYVAEGERFLCGAPVVQLCKLFRDKFGKNVVNLLDLIEFIQSLTAEELGNANGMWVTLSAGACIISPPGWFLCESTTSDLSIHVQTVCGSKSQITNLITKDMLKLCTVLSKGTALKFVQLSVQHGSGMRDRLVAFDSESSTKEKDQNEKAAAEEEKNEKAEENNEEVPAHLLEDVPSQVPEVLPLPDPARLEDVPDAAFGGETQLGSTQLVESHQDAEQGERTEQPDRASSVSELQEEVTMTEAKGNEETHQNPNPDHVSKSALGEERLDPAAMTEKETEVISPGDAHPELLEERRIDPAESAPLGTGCSGRELGKVNDEAVVNQGQVHDESHGLDQVQNKQPPNHSDPITEDILSVGSSPPGSPGTVCKDGAKAELDSPGAGHVSNADGLAAASGADGGTEGDSTLPKAKRARTQSAFGGDGATDEAATPAHATRRSRVGHEADTTTYTPIAKARSSARAKRSPAPTPVRAVETIADAFDRSRSRAAASASSEHGRGRGKGRGRKGASQDGNAAPKRATRKVRD